MIRKAFRMQINANAYAEYESRHNPIWAELEKVLKDHGVHHYSIFLDKELNHLFAYVELESELLWESISKTEICQKWWQYMSDLMPTNPDKSPKSATLSPVFYLE